MAGALKTTSGAIVKSSVVGRRLATSPLAPTFFFFCSVAIVYIQFEEISWYSIKIRKLGEDKPS
jgi:hypothetical protein